MVILELLNIDEFYGKSEIIEIAKGKYKLPTNLKEGLKQVKREYYAKRGNRN